MRLCETHSVFQLPFLFFSFFCRQCLELWNCIRNSVGIGVDDFKNLSILWIKVVSLAFSEVFISHVRSRYKVKA